jgi:hypothetical protein
VEANPTLFQKLFVDFARILRAEHGHASFAFNLSAVCEELNESTEAVMVSKMAGLANRGCNLVKYSHQRSTLPDAIMEVYCNINSNPPASATMSASEAQNPPLELKFSHNIIEHLGLKLYQNKPSNVLAELVSNAWDADSSSVWIELLDTLSGAPSAILVSDDGIGMADSDLISRYLIVGLPKRSGENPNERSAKGRALMGRKGIGKLAPFGVAKELDLITVKGGLVTWLRFDYDDMLLISDITGELAKYRPKIICRMANIATVPLDAAGAEVKSIEAFFTRISAGGSGTMIAAKKLTLKRVITPQHLKEALGRRFTVTLARPDFKLLINGDELSEGDVFPAWELRIPVVNFETAFVATPSGPKEIRYWAGFVASAAWSHEEAGVGIYAHGKIGQDRPFFFGNKGKEIFSRYLYAVVEADWVDELARDTISTDRTSMDWDDDNLAGLRQWGEAAVKNWIGTYEKHRRVRATHENMEVVNSVIGRNPALVIRNSEKEHLVALLSDVTPRLGKDAENKERLVEATVKAWVHEPARKLIKELWEKASQFEPDSFSHIVVRLVDQLVPESLSLAVVFSQRVYALTQLENHIMKGKETQLQELLEQFPWILDNTYEQYLPRRSLKTICDEAEAEGKFNLRNVHLPENSANTKPDFVFFGDVTNAKLLVVELKGPDETAAWPEYQQLFSYMSYLQSRYTDATVEGILIARSFDAGIIKQKGPTIQFKAWPELLLRSRKDHMAMLAAILAGTTADAQDARVQQICELGGPAVTGFLEKMSDQNEDLKSLVNRLKSHGPKSPK